MTKLGRMTMLRISKELSLPLDFVTSTQAILAKKRVGKSYTAQVEAEELLEAKQQVVVLDPTDAWWGLRSSADGKSAGYPITIFGGRHGDAPLDASAGSQLASAIVSETFSAVVSLKLFSKTERLRFAADFLETIYRENRDAMHLFLDEADTFVPQTPRSKEQSRCMEAADELVRRGGIDGVGVTLISQRAAVLNKDVLSQIDRLIVLRIIARPDIRQVTDWISVHGTAEQVKELESSLPSLGRGSAWIWTPEDERFKRITIREKRTFDSGRTPKAGERRLEPKQLAPVDLERLGRKLAETVERAKSNDPKALRARVAELETQLAAKPAPAAKMKTVDNPVLKSGELAKLERLVERFEKASESISGLAGDVGDQMEVVRRELARLHQPAPERTNVNQGHVAAAWAANTLALERSAPVAPAAPARATDAMPGSRTTTPAQQRILDTMLLLVRLDIASERDVLAAWCKTHPRSKGFVNNVGALRSMGYVAADGFALTVDGYARARAMPRPTREDAQAAILSALSPAQRRIAEIVLARGEIGRDELGQALGKHPRSKGVVNNIGALRSRRIVSDDWPLRPTHVLEPTGGA